MNPTNIRSTAAYSPIAAAVYTLLAILLFPVTLIGYIAWVCTAFLVGRSSKASTTAQGPLSARWLQHHLGVRLDEPANRLMFQIPGISPLVVYLTEGSMLLAHRVSGYVPKTFRYPYQGEVAIQDEGAARQTFLDRAVDQSLARMKQFVILGAGYDTRAYRLPKGSGVRSFEVDTPATQSFKRELLAKAGIDTTGVSFVSADFEQEDWLEKLVAAGFDPGQPALFIWEGVIVYLDREAVESTLRKIASTAKGSTVAFDYFTDVPLVSASFYWRYARVATKSTGEPFKFGIDSTPPSRERLAEFIRTCGLVLEEQYTWGDETGGKRAWGGFATAAVR